MLILTDHGKTHDARNWKLIVFGEIGGVAFHDELALQVVKSIRPSSRLKRPLKNAPKTECKTESSFGNVMIPLASLPSGSNSNGTLPVNENGEHSYSVKRVKRETDQDDLPEDVSIDIRFSSEHGKFKCMFIYSWLSLNLSM